MANFDVRLSPRGWRGGHASAFRPPRGLFLGVVAAAVVLAAPHLVFASGEERTTLGDDLLIRTDTRWAGGALGGYLPLRIEIANQGPARTLTFEVTPSDRTHGATVKRVIGVDQHATVRFTLPVPLVEFRQGVLRVYDGRGELESHVRVVGGGEVQFLDIETAPAMLVVSSRPVDRTGYISAATGSHGGVRLPAQPEPAASVLAEVVPPDSLPDSWIDFTGLDFVAISRDDLADLRTSSRSAVLKWVRCGGNLLVHHAGKSSKDAETLERLLEFPQKVGAGANWIESDVRKTQPPFATRELMLGLVCVFPDELPDSANDWSAIFPKVGALRFSWMRRHGVAPDVGTEEFFNFMNPGIRGVPVLGFMVLITAFAVLIGPVNYFYLRRERLLWLLLVTVPATALLTSMLLVGYSVATHGFGIRSRIRSLTVLDQKSHSAVTVARLALFAGLAPSRGMEFSQETAVYPVFPRTAEPGAFTVDWTQGQALTSGWLYSRTRTQFLTIRHAEQPEGVQIKAGQNGTLAIVNGLPWELEAVLVSDESGGLSWASNVLPRASQPLAAASGTNRADFVGLLRRNRPELPDNFSSPARSPLIGRRQRRQFNVFASRFPGAHFDSNLMERLIQAWSRDLTTKTTCLSPRSYLAVVRQNPGVETGVGPTTEQAGYHLLLGYY